MLLIVDPLPVNGYVYVVPRRSEAPHGQPATTRTQDMAMPKRMVRSESIGSPPPLGIDQRRYGRIWRFFLRILLQAFCWDGLFTLPLLNLVRPAPLPRWQVVALETVGRFFTKTIPQGAATSCYVATAPALMDVSGHFFNHCNPHRPGGFTEDRDLASRLWTVSEELTEGYA